MSENELNDESIEQPEAEETDPEVVLHSAEEGLMDDCGSFACGVNFAAE